MKKETLKMNPKWNMKIALMNIIMLMIISLVVIAQPSVISTGVDNSITSVKNLHYENYEFDKVEFSPNGSTLVTSCINNGTLIIFNATTWEITNVVKTDGDNNKIDFNPNGTMLAIGRRSFHAMPDVGKLNIINTTTWKIIKTIYLNSTVSSVSWNPDGTRIATAGKEMIQIIDTQLWIPIKIFEANLTFEVAWNPDGSLLAYGNASSWEEPNPSIEVYYTSNWTKKYNITDFPDQENPYFVSCLKWSNDGKTLVASNKSVGFYEDGSLSFDIINFSTWVKSMEWRPKGNVLCVVNNTDLDLYNGSSFEMIITKNVGRFIQNAAWSPNSTLLVTSSNSYIEIFRVALPGIDGSTGGGGTDSDNDGVEDNSDAFPMDPAASRDNDSDGYPGEWNDGMNQSDSTTGLEFDHFSKDPAAYKDTDVDGSPDMWIEGFGPDDSVTGLHIDKFPLDSAASQDRDNDGAPDDWNPGKTKEDSISGLYRDNFPNDPAASIDQDFDGFPSSWNIGKSQEDSIEGLILDIFPMDPSEWFDTDNDQIGDNSDLFPMDPAASMDTDRDGYPDMWHDGMSSEDSTTGLWVDLFPMNPNEWKDTDGDLIGDNSDAFPTDPSASMDDDKDGLPDVWNPGMSKDDSTTGLKLDPKPDDPDNIINEGNDPFWKNDIFWITAIPIFLLIIISIIIISFMLASRKEGVKENDPYSFYRKGLLNNGEPAGFEQSRGELDGLMEDLEGEETISEETLGYIKGFIEGEM